MSAFIATLIAVTAATASADSYDGKWTASGLRNAHCLSFDADIAVSGSQITIGIRGAGSYTLRGTVAPDGSFDAVTSNATVNVSGKFNGDKVEFILRAGCGIRNGSGQRAE